MPCGCTAVFALRGKVQGVGVANEVRPNRRLANTPSSFVDGAHFSSEITAAYGILSLYGLSVRQAFGGKTIQSSRPLPQIRAWLSKVKSHLAHMSLGLIIQTPILDFLQGRLCHPMWTILRDSIKINTPLSITSLTSSSMAKHQGSVTSRHMDARTIKYWIRGFSFQKETKTLT
jgi:hypothetical protein